VDPQELQRLAPGIDSGDLEGRGLEEPLDELPVQEAVIHGQDMERGLCGHRHGRNKRADVLLLVFLHLTRRRRRRMLCYEQLQSGRVAEETKKSREVCVLGMRGFVCLLKGVVELLYIYRHMKGFQEI